MFYTVSSLQLRYYHIILPDLAETASNVAAPSERLLFYSLDNQLIFTKNLAVVWWMEALHCLLLH